MIFNSEIIIVNATPVRGTVSGKRTRLPGTSGKLFANVNHGYVFKHWLDRSNNTIISTANPLELTDWQSMEIEAVFDNEILDTQFYEDRDALETETLNIEQAGVQQTLKETAQATSSLWNSMPSDSRGVASPLIYYTQGIRNWVTTRTSSIGDVFNIPVCDWGWNYDNPLIGTGTYDPATNTITPATGHSWYRSPTTHSQVPLSGIEASRYIYNIDAIRGDPNEISYNTILWMPSECRNRGRGNGDETYTIAEYSPYWGIRNNPSVGESTQYPMIEYTPFRYFIAGANIEPLDTKGISKNYNPLSIWHRSVLPEYTYIVNLDGFQHATDCRVLQLSRGIITSRSDGHPLKYDKTIPTPRLIETVNYMPSLNHAMLRADTIPYSKDNYTWQGGPRDTLFGTASSNNWVQAYQQTPKSGSLLYNFRYSKLNVIHFNTSTPVTDFSMFIRYGKNLKYVVLMESYYTQGNANDWTTPDFSEGKFKGIKNLEGFYWGDVYNHAFTESIKSWRGLRDCNNLKYLYINATSKVTENMKYSDIPPDCKYVYIYPPPPASSNDPFPGETVVMVASATSNGLEDFTRYDVNITSSSTIIETLT